MAAFFGGYVIGSLPLGYLAGRRWGGVDLRRVGSQNVGATNMYRVSGARLGLLVMLLDVAKGAGAVVLATAWSREPVDAAVAAVAAVAGHVYPVWLRGRGGKGVATACGAFAMLAPAATVLAAALFAITVAVTRMASAGSVVAAVSLPPLVAVTGAELTIAGAAAATALLILWRHRGNLGRLWRGTERRLAAREVPRA